MVRAWRMIRGVRVSPCGVAAVGAVAANGERVRGAGGMGMYLTPATLF